MKKSKRAEWIFCIIVIWTAAIFQGYGLAKTSGEEKSLEVFYGWKLSLMEGCLEISAPVKEYKTEKEQKRILEKLGKGERKEKNFIEVTDRESSDKKISIRTMDGELETELSFMTRKLPDGVKETDVYQYLYITCKCKEEIDRLVEKKYIFEERLKRMDLEPFSNINLKGIKDGCLTEKEKQEIGKKLFRSLKATEVETVENEDMYTVYGYSRLLKDTLAYGENEINLNLAFTYDEKKNRTLFYLSMPYIRMDY